MRLFFFALMSVMECLRDWAGETLLLDETSREKQKVGKHIMVGESLHHSLPSAKSLHKRLLNLARTRIIN